MRIVYFLKEFCIILCGYWCQGKIIGLVFIMGNLYEGYIFLVCKVIEVVDVVVISIFVNFM